MLRRRLSVVPCAFVLTAAGCTSPLAGTLARQTAGHVEHLNEQMVAYQTALQQNAADRIERLADERADVMRLSLKLDHRLAVWKLAKHKDATTLYDGVIQQSDVAIMKQRELARRAQQERAALLANQQEFRDQQQLLGSLARRLNALADDPDLEQQARFFYDFGRRVKDTIDDLGDELADETEK